MQSRIIYTLTDEAPALATCSLLPIFRAFAKTAGVQIETRDISLAGRIIAAFPECLKEDLRRPDHLAELGRMVQQPEANIIKLPNISASVPQLTAAIRELQAAGYSIPDYPAEPVTDQDIEIKRRYDAIKGSAVNPVLREGNSDRRAPVAVKNYAKRHPHSMGAWSADSETHVSSMQTGDFYGSEISLELSESQTAVIELISAGGEPRILKSGLVLEAGEVMDASVMSRNALDEFLKEQIEDARRRDVLFSVHLKATMMKVSDPVIFGRAVYAYFRRVFDKHAGLFKELGVQPENGLADLYTKIEGLPNAAKEAIKADLTACRKEGPDIAMVDSEKGITNLHVPSDVIIDASMPAAIRSGGRMWASDGSLKDMKAVIPDRSYAGIYQAVIDFCKEQGALDPTSLGTVSNVGLMAGKAEEYGSHDTTFVVSEKGTIRVKGSGGVVLIERSVEEGDIFRICRVKDAPVQNWVALAFKRAKETKDPAVFWLDEHRAHDRILIRKVRQYLGTRNTKDLDLRIMPPSEATTFTLQRMAAGKDTISVTGNVLRDYLTDLFPILELGTSAKMLSIVPLLEGGRLFETGAGGSAPKHVQQFLQEGHLRWDSLGEFLAMAVSLKHIAEITGNEKARILAECLDAGTEELLEQRKSPSRSVGELDTRGSHFYLALYWAKALAAQSEDGELQKTFENMYRELKNSEERIIADLAEARGQAVDIGGYYFPSPARVEQAMRPSSILNTLFL
jgi:isocitrate dehydrogenase